MMEKTTPRANLLSSLLYFFFFAASGCITPYLNIFFQAKGISIAQISILGAMPMGLTLVAAPVWAGIADYFGLHRKILPLIMFLTMPFVALLGAANSFLVLLPAMIFYGICNSPIMSLSDNSVLSFLGSNRHNYGHVRLWGSIGWGLMGWLSGIMIDRFGPITAYVGFFIFMFLAVWVASKMPEPDFIKGVPYWDSLGRVLKDNRWVAFLIGSFLVGIAFMFITNYFYIFLKDLGAPSSLTGLSVASSVILELPFFIFSAALIKKVSARGLIIFSFFVLILRLIFTSMLVNPYWGVAVNMLHGPFFSTYWTGAVNYAREIAPRGLGASAQALFAASFFGLGGIVGALLGGWLFTRFGPPVMFQTGAGLTLLGLIVFFWLGKSKAMTGLN
jgi:PPP family 3-phenylpropionic acid transporter